MSELKLPSLRGNTYTQVTAKAKRLCAVEGAWVTLCLYLRAVENSGIWEQGNYKSFSDWYRSELPMGLGLEAYYTRIRMIEMYGESVARIIDPVAARAMTADAILADANKIGRMQRYFEEYIKTHKQPPTVSEIRQKAHSVIGKPKIIRRPLMTEPLTETVVDSPLPPIVEHSFPDERFQATAIALLSDVHSEESVDPESIYPYRNEYNMDICNLRLQKFFDAVIREVKFAKHQFEIDTLVLWLGGDFLTNGIHPDGIPNKGPGDTIIWIQSRLIAGIQKLLDSGFFKYIRIPCSFGNHGRTTEVPRIAAGWDHNIEWLMYNNIGLYFKNDSRVTVSAPKSNHVYQEVYGFELHFHHGQEIGRGGSGDAGIIPSMMKSVKKWKGESKAEQLHYFGHYHSYIIPKPSVVGNGSLIGYNAFAKSIKAEPEPPVQHFELLTPQGKARLVPIWVVDEKEEAKLRKSQVKLVG